MRAFIVLARVHVRVRVLDTHIKAISSSIVQRLFISEIFFHFVFKHIHAASIYTTSRSYVPSMCGYLIYTVPSLTLLRVL